jgi:hypothetical protein
LPKATIYKLLQGLRTLIPLPLWGPVPAVPSNADASGGKTATPPSPSPIAVAEVHSASQVVVSNASTAISAQALRAPVLSAVGTVLRWTAIGKHHVYRMLIRAPGRRTIITVTTRTASPAAMPGETVIYQVKAAYGESGWSNPVAITYPAPKKEEPPKEEPPKKEPPKEEPPKEEEHKTPPPLGEMIVGLDAGGWGPSAFADIAGATKNVRLGSRFATDSEVGAAAAAGVRVASWLVGSGGTIGSINPAAMAAEIVALFKRYGKGGTFWAGKTDLGGTSVELLNEPGNPYFWSDANNYAAYANLSRVVHAALEASFPPAIRPKLLLSYDGGFSGDEYGRAIFAAGAVADGVTVHPYGGKSNPTISAQGHRERAIQAHAETGLPVYVTEIGWPTAVGQPPTGDSLQWTEQQQAENVTNFVHWAAETKYVAMVVIFNYVDYGSNDWYGIERRDRTHKLSFTALGEASGALAASAAPAASEPLSGVAPEAPTTAPAPPGG